MRKKTNAVIFACLAFVLIVFLSWLAEGLINKQVSNSIISDYLTQEGQLATQIAASLENEVSNIETNLNIMAIIPDISNTTDPVACNAHLQQIFITTHQKLSNLGRIGANGDFICSLNKALIGLPGKKLGTYIPEIFNDPNHNPVISHAIKPLGASGYVVAIHVPVYTSQDVFDGTLGGAISLTDIQNNFLKDVKFAENGYAALIDNNGDILYSPTPDLIGENLSSPRVTALIGSNGISKWQQAVANANAGNSGTVDYISHGVAKLATYQRATILPGHNWVVIVAVPKQDAVRALDNLGINQAFRLIGLTLFVTIGAATALLLFTSLHSIRLQQTLGEKRDWLALERSRAQTLLSSIGDGVVAIDRSWKITLFNDTAVSLTGWTAAEAIGKPLCTVMSFIREFDRQEDMTFVEQAMVVGQQQNPGNHMLLKRRDGNDLPIGGSTAPIMGADQQIHGAIIVIRSLAQEKEEQRMKSDFAYASHQFRTPVSQVLVALGLLETQQLPPKAKQTLDNAMVGIKSIQKLTSDLLAASDVENKRVIPKPALVNLTEIVQKALKPIAELAKQQGHKIEMNITRDTESVATDPVLLDRILHELLDNTLHYSDPRTTITIAARTENGQLILSVENHGMSISEEELPLIYTKFFRGTNKPAQSSGGGLGLYIAKLYVELLDGRMWFVSKDRTTIFYVSIPLRHDI
jgi:PAS domain S-box-containing protein